MSQSVDLDRCRNWFTELTDRLSELDGSAEYRADLYDQICLAREGVFNIQAVIPPEFPDRSVEIAFYQEIWPKFYGKLFYYYLLQHFWDKCWELPAGTTGVLVAEEEERVCRFFRRHRKFWRDYRFEIRTVEDLFTRDYACKCFFEPLGMLLVAARTTPASYRAAWGLAYEQYRDWLRKFAESGVSERQKSYEWKESKSAAAEWIKAQVEATSIYINGKPATAAQLRVDFEQRYGVDLKDYDNLLYQMDTLKIEETPYLTKLKNAFTGWKRRLGK
ncbi:MAG TPA: RteC domain-containing protein [Puia sp.]|jgi:hypothetical protein|nr:RteC domain-containing protein [Puia sp.]